MELAGAAAACFCACGYRRNGYALRHDVAEALMRRHAYARAAALIEGQCRAFLREGWSVLAAGVLAQLVACQKV